jgi:hypothetical protein
MNTVFTQVNRTLRTLMDDIAMGEICLPDNIITIKYGQYS